MAGSPCPIEVMKQVITKLHMPQVTVNSNMFEQKMTSRQLHSVGQLVDQASCQSVSLTVSQLESSRSVSNSVNFSAITEPEVSQLLIQSSLRQSLVNQSVFRSNEGLTLETSV